MRTNSREFRGRFLRNQGPHGKYFTLRMGGGLIQKKDMVSFTKSNGEGVSWSQGRPINTGRARLNREGLNRYAPWAVWSWSDGGHPSSRKTARSPIDDRDRPPKRYSPIKSPPHANRSTAPEHPLPNSNPSRTWLIQCPTDRLPPQADPGQRQAIPTAEIHRRQLVLRPVN